MVAGECMPHSLTGVLYCSEPTPQPFGTLCTVTNTSVGGQCDGLGECTCELPTLACRRSAML